MYVALHWPTGAPSAQPASPATASSALLLGPAASRLGRLESREPAARQGPTAHPVASSIAGPAVRPQGGQQLGPPAHCTKQIHTRCASSRLRTPCSYAAWCWQQRSQPAVIPARLFFQCAVGGQRTSVAWVTMKGSDAWATTGAVCQASCSITGLGGLALPFLCVAGGSMCAPMAHKWGMGEAWKAQKEALLYLAVLALRPNVLQCARSCCWIHSILAFLAAAPMAIVSCCTQTQTN